MHGKSSSAAQKDEIHHLPGAPEILFRSAAKLP